MGERAVASPHPLMRASEASEKLWKSFPQSLSKGSSTCLAMNSPVCMSSLLVSSLCCTLVFPWFSGFVLSSCLFCMSELTLSLVLQSDCGKNEMYCIDILNKYYFHLSLNIYTGTGASFESAWRGRGGGWRWGVVWDRLFTRPHLGRPSTTIHPHPSTPGVSSVPQN